jgi:pyruvate dehydrogenase E1 component beta subunit
MRYLQALAKALRDEMETDPKLVVLGEDVRESLRGVTKGLAADFDDRVDMPISEQMFTGSRPAPHWQGTRSRRVPDPAPLCTRSSRSSTRRRSCS